MFKNYWKKNKVLTSAAHILKEEKDIAKSSEIPKYNKTYTQAYPNQN